MPFALALVGSAMIGSAQAGFVERHLTLTATLTRTTDHQVTYALELENQANRDVVVGLIAGDAKLTDGQAEKEVAVWVDLAHPFSTREVDPIARTLPAGERVPAGELHLLLERTDRRPEDRLEVEMAIVRKRRTTLVALPPQPVSE